MEQSTSSHASGGGGDNGGEDAQQPRHPTGDQGLQQEQQPTSPKIKQEETCSSPHHVPIEHPEAAVLHSGTFQASQVGAALSAAQHQASLVELSLSKSRVDPTSSARNPQSPSPRQYGNDDLSNGGTAEAVDLRAQQQQQLRRSSSLRLGGADGHATQASNAPFFHRDNGIAPIGPPVQFSSSQHQLQCPIAFQQSRVYEPPMSLANTYHGLPLTNTLSDIQFHHTNSNWNHCLYPPSIAGQYYSRLRTAPEPLASTSRNEFLAPPSTLESIPSQPDGQRLRKRRIIEDSEEEGDGGVESKIGLGHLGHLGVPGITRGSSPKRRREASEHLLDSDMHQDAECLAEEEEISDHNEKESLSNTHQGAGTGHKEDERGAVEVMHECESADESDDEPLATRTRNDRNDVPSSSPTREISWALPKYEVQELPAKENGDVEAQISLPGCIREKIILSPDHAPQELHLFKQVFLPSQQALESPDNDPRVAILNFHQICVMVLDSYHAHQEGDLEPSTTGAKQQQSTHKVNSKDAREVDVDEIFFAVIDRWRTGLTAVPGGNLLLKPGGNQLLKPAYALIRGAQEFCDIALDIIHFIKQHGMLVPTPRVRAQRSDKGIKRKTQEKSRRPKNGTNMGRSTTNASTKAKTANAGKRTASCKDVGTKLNPHRPAIHKKARTTSPKEKLGAISVTKRTLGR